MGIRILGNRLSSKLKKIPIHPSFALFFIWIVIFNDFFVFLSFLVALLTHEAGHFYVAKKLGYKLNSFYIAPYGVNLNYKEKVFSHNDEILIAIAGPLVNLSLSVVCVAFWWIFPVWYGYLYQFVFQSMILCLMNLLPCYPLDGGRVFASLLSKSMPRGRAIKIVYILNYLFSAILIILFIISLFINFNPSLCLCGCFLLLGVVDSKFESKYQPTVFTKGKTKNFSRPFFVMVDESVKLKSLLKHIEPNRHTIFVVLLKEKTEYIDERQVREYLLKFSFTSTIGECIKQEKG